MKKPLVVAEDIGVQYGAVVALSGVSFVLNSGFICGLIGVNGSGKTSLFKALLGLISHTGSVQLAGSDALQARKRGAVAYMPQKEDISINFPILVAEVVMTGRFGKLGFTRKPKPADHDAVSMALRRVDLLEMANRPISELSGGQLKRVFLARALAQEAQVLLLDEPFAGIDPASEKQIRLVLHDEAKRGAAILVSTHNLVSLKDLAHEAIILKQTVLMHADIETVLKPENIALGFGIYQDTEHRSAK